MMMTGHRQENQERGRTAPRLLLRKGNTSHNNLGPDRLAGPKALDPNYSRQPTL